MQKTEPERPSEAHEETSNGVTDNTNVSDMPLEALRGSPYASGASVGKGANRDRELGTFFKDKPHITPPPTFIGNNMHKKFVNTEGRKIPTMWTWRTETTQRMS